MLGLLFVPSGSVSTGINMPAVLMVVNIDVCRYCTRMTRTSKAAASRQLDPDVQLLAALADPVRLAIVRELAASNEVCACDFTSCCDVRQPTVSHHLKVLKEAGIVDSERQGSFIYYRLRPSAAARLAAIAREILPGNVIPLSEITRRPSQPAPAPRPS
jgi:ArsR family transcriptional regulator